MFKNPKPYSAVTVQIDHLTHEQYEENDIGGIVDLIEVIRIQPSGPTEAARAIRKKLKYGNVHRQLRALTILDGLIQNAGTRFQRAFADEPLLERLRLMARDDMVDSEVKAKCNLLFRQWAVAYKGTPGLTGISTLSKELPRTKRPQRSQSKVIRETAHEAQHDDPPPAHSHKRSTSRTQPTSSRDGATLPPAPVLPSTSLFKKSKSKNKPFNLEKEEPKLRDTIASASIASENLLNALKRTNRELERVSEKPEVQQHFKTCKQRRHDILNYIQLVESEQWIGGLLKANDELVRALMAYEIMDKSIDDDSDSETETAIARSAAEAEASSPPRDGMARLHLNHEAPPAKPPRPTSMGFSSPHGGKQRVEESESDEEEEEEEEEGDENDPFGDQNAVKTPFVEKDGMTWRDV